MIDNLFLSAGAMKSGTTWLYKLLLSHPDIHFCYEKEIRYFSYIAGIGDTLDYGRRQEKKVFSKTAEGRSVRTNDSPERTSWYAEYANKRSVDGQWYENLFRMRGNEKWVADFTNHYGVMGDSGWDNVRRVAKNVKVIYTMRDPIERLWSHYKYDFKWNNRENEVLQHGFKNFRNKLDNGDFLAHSDYSRNIERLERKLDASELMLFYFEDFRRDPEGMLCKLQDFLEVQRIAFDREAILRKVNVTKDIEMPKKWEEYAYFKLRQMIEKMDDRIWREDWTTKRYW